MALIKSISGIRGTIGGATNDNLTPLDVVKFTAAYGTWLIQQGGNKKVVIGRDGRISGGMIKQLVINTLIGLGLDVVDLDYSTTPTVEMAVQFEGAAGGIILTASHNPREWNALKLLNHKGEFISGAEGERILELAKAEAFDFAAVDKLGTCTGDGQSLKKLKALGVKDVVVLNGEVNGRFAHNPEPLPEHLTQLSSEVVKENAHLGIAVDPDVDRLCFVCEDGTMFGEEYTLVAVADYVLGKRKGNTVSNMSSTRALKDITLKHGGEYFASAVGEVNVVEKMKAVDAVIGGEGNGGIIVPDLHYGRDALIGIALFLSHLALSKKSIRQLRNGYPDYFMSKQKISFDKQFATDAERKAYIDGLFNNIQARYKNNPSSREDGLKIEFDTDWVHLRTSNTEPIIRIYTESSFETTANNIAQKLMHDIGEVM
jgi:phosphomannomutase